jgi:hypothetical protein
MKIFKTRSGDMKRVNKSTNINETSTITSLASINTSSSSSSPTYTLLFEKINNCDRFYSDDVGVGSGVCEGAVTTGYFQYDQNSSIIYIYLSNDRPYFKQQGLDLDSIKKINILNQITFSIKYDSINGPYYIYKFQDSRDTVLNKLDTLILEKNNQIVKQDKFFYKGLYQIFTDKGNGSLILQ